MEFLAIGLLNKKKTWAVVALLAATALKNLSSIRFRIFVRYLVNFRHFCGQLQMQGLFLSRKYDHRAIRFARFCVSYRVVFLDS